MKILLAYFFPVFLLISAAMAAPLLALAQARRAERMGRHERDAGRWLLAALLLTAMLSLGLFVFVLVYA